MDKNPFITIMYAGPASFACLLLSFSLTVAFVCHEIGGWKRSGWYRVSLGTVMIFCAFLTTLIFQSMLQLSDFLGFLNSRGIADAYAMEYIFTSLVLFLMIGLGEFAVMLGTMGVLSLLGHRVAKG